MTDLTSRYHGLDALRGIAMVLGIVLHAALPYIPGIPSSVWPSDSSSSYLIKIIFEFIHMWRMPLFFILAGFFANLIITRKSWEFWWTNRFLRVGLPMVVFFPVMGFILPSIWKYGQTGEFNFFYSDIGQPFHLWFLWQLIIFTLCSMLLRILYKGFAILSKQLEILGLSKLESAFLKLRDIGATIIFRAKFPVGFILVCAVTNLWTGGELIINPIGSGLYFLFGFSLYTNPSLIRFVKKQWPYYLFIAFLVFSIYVGFDIRGVKDVTEIIYQGEVKGIQVQNLTISALSRYGLEIIGTVLFAIGFIGLSEAKFGSYHPLSRFISDGSYWMYLIHLPIVALTTFVLFNWSFFPEVKFVLSIAFTTGVCLITYRYFVRSSFIGVFLNGKRNKRSYCERLCSQCGISSGDSERFCIHCGISMPY